MDPAHLGDQSPNAWDSSQLVDVLARLALRGRGGGDRRGRRSRQGRDGDGDAALDDGRAVRRAVRSARERVFGTQLDLGRNSRLAGACAARVLTRDCDGGGGVLVVW